MGVRETALVLPLLLTLCLARVAWCASPGRAGEVLRAALRASAAHWLLGAAGMLLVLALPRYRELLAVSLEARAPLDNLVTQAGATLYLLGQLLRPFALNADPRPPVFAGWDWGWALVCSAWLLALVLAVWRSMRGSFAAFAVLWFAIALLPTNSLIARLDVVNERQLYLAALPLYALPALAWDRVWLGSHRPPLGIMALLVGVLLAATVLRNRDYHTETAFWASVLARDAGNARAWNNFGYALEQEQPERFAEALAAYQHAIALDPSDYKPRHNRLLLCARHPDASGCASRGL
jgi:tetratricopeptide (TPR) repeat protein